MAPAVSHGAPRSSRRLPALTPPEMPGEGSAPAKRSRQPATVDLVDPVTFAEARLAEDEAGADELHNRIDCDLDRLQFVGDCSCSGPARALRDAQAGRRILERHRPDEFGCQRCPDPVLRPCPDLADLLYRWADHIDYEPAWLPDGL